MFFGHNINIMIIKMYFKLNSHAFEEKDNKKDNTVGMIDVQL